MTYEVPANRPYPVTDKIHASPGRPHRKKRHKHDYNYWLCEPYNSVRGETSLWAAVITQALMDALSNSRNPEHIRLKHEAIEWLTGAGKDFTLVCLFAGMDPDYVRQKAKQSITSPSPWRAPPGKGKRYLERKAYRKRLREQKLAQRRQKSSGGAACSERGTVIEGSWLRPCKIA